MASIDSLDDRQRAVLQLLLSRGQSYDDLAALLRTDASSVRMRARGAVATLGRDAGDLPGDRRDEISDYLLGQQTAAQRAATRAYLQGSAAGRAWARAAVAALAPIGGATLPDIPAERAQVGEAPGAATPPPIPAERAQVGEEPGGATPPPIPAARAQGAEAPDALEGRSARQEEVTRSAKLGTRLLIGGVGVVLGIVVILAINLSDGDDPGSAATPTATMTTGNVQTTPTGDKFQVVAQGTLAPPKNVKSGAKGQVAIVRFPDNNQFRLAVQATGLAPSRTRGAAYGVWLYTSDEKKEFLGFPKRVGRDGRLETVSDLSPETPAYAAVLLTRETADKPTRPGAVVLIAPMVTEADALKQRTQTQTTTTP